MAIIDLHTHSTASDGTLSPVDLVNLAATSGIAGLALTDHDTIDGLDEAIEAAKKHSLTFVPGVEVSADLEKGALHILGLHIDHLSPELTKLLDWLIIAREERNRKLIKKLNDLGLPVSQDEIKEAAGAGATGRPHFATVMKNKGYVKNVQAAFKRYLGSSGSAHVKRRKPSIEWAIRAIRQSGGVPTLAHPDQTLLSGEPLKSLLNKLSSMGLEGIEVYYSGYTQSRIREYSDLAKTFHLVKTGGSDFHGAVKPGIRLGRGPGRLYVPEELLEPLRERARQIRDAEEI